MATNHDILNVNIISIIISGLIIRVIYVSFDTLKVMTEETVDDEPIDRYRRSSYYILNWFIVSGLCIFAGLLIYSWYVRKLRE